MSPSTVAVVIPAYNEQVRIRATVEAARTIPEVSVVVVVDAGSTDAPAALAKEAGAITVPDPPGLRPAPPARPRVRRRGGADHRRAPAGAARGGGSRRPRPPRDRHVAQGPGPPGPSVAGRGPGAGGPSRPAAVYPGPARSRAAAGRETLVGARD